MATATAPSMAAMAAPYPRHDTDAELRERRDMEVEMRLWTLRVRFFARDLLALGRPYTVQYTLPPGVARPASVGDLPELGFELLPLLSSHVMQIKRVFPSRGGVLSQRITSLHNAPLITSDVSPLDAMQPYDFLIGINDDDVLLAPTGSQSQVRKRILHECNHALQQQQQFATSGNSSTVLLTLKFVRMDRVVQVDPTRQLAHGNVLAALEQLESHHHALAQRYDELQSINRAAATQRLTRHLKLLRHCHGVMCDLKDACMEVFAYQIAEQFQAWLAVELADFNPRYDDEGEEGEEQEQDQPQEDVSMDGPTVFEIDDDDDDDEEDEEQNGDDNKRQAEGHHHPPQRATAATREQRLKALGAANVDLRWRDVLHPHEMKWLPQSHAVLTKFIEGLADGFASDGVWRDDMAVRSRSIVERLVVLYAKKLQTTSTDNATVKKEFLQHARMLRSNVANAGNKQLRADLLSGVLSVVTLCEMTSEQLAPEALQAERQRREETHTKEITLSEPTGPRLVKTKHGFKEVNVGGSNDQHETDSVGTSQPPVAEQESRAVNDDTAVATTTETKLTDEVTKRLGAMEFEKDKEPFLPKPAPAQERSAPPPLPPRQQLIHRDQSTAPPARGQPSVAARDVSSVEAARYSAEDGRVFLRAMFDPDQEMVEDTLRRLQETIHSTNILATMHSELKIAGISMYRDLQAMRFQYGVVQHRARVRLLHWMFEYVGHTDRDATIGVLSRLVKELEEYRRLFGQLLEQLRYELHFPQPLHNHHAHRAAINLLVRQGMSLKAQRRENGDFRAEAQLDRMTLAVAHDSSDPAARDRAAHDATAFLSELVARKRSPSHAVARDSYRDQHHQHQQHWRRDDDRPRELHHAFPRTDEYRQSDRNPYRDGGDNRDSRRSFEPPLGLMDRKRPLEPGHFTEPPPPPLRRRVEQEEPMTNGIERNAPPAPEVESAPLFFTDARGQTEPTPVDPNAKERAEKNQVEAYQELVRALIRNRDDVLERAKSVDWDPHVPEKTIEFSSRLSVVRKISRHSVKSLFQCEVRGMDGNLYLFSENSSLDSAAQHVMKTLRKWLDDIRCNWLALADTYKVIMQRKEKQRGQQADAALSAANETRKDRSVSRFVEDKERKRGHMHEYVVYVQSLVAVRQVCLNMKMAKRAAGEEFRDLMIWINRTRTDIPHSNGRSSASPAPAATATATTAAASARAAPKPRNHASNMIVLSDDSDDDDGDDDDYYGGGGAYSDDDDGGDWHPQPKQPTDSHAPAAGASSTTTTTTSGGGKSVRLRVEAMLAEPYPVESERFNGDDARLRAVLRSLFTPEDDLCTEISAIRGALKYRGQFDKQVVPNVKASIRLDLLRGDVFNVYASANDVVHYKATATSKQEACDKAVDGLLEELNNTRRMWVQLVHFYHVKEMGTNDPMRSFHALQLANIARIETKIEPPPVASSTMHNRPLEAKMATRVHGVMYIGGKVVFRVDEDLEQDAHTIATCRTVQFLVDLIDKGLDPMPVDIQDNDFRPMRRVDWSCMVSLQDFGNRRELVEFHADACWAVPGRVPRDDCDFVVPSRATLRHVNRVPVQDMERSLNASHAFFFRLEATYENGKFVNHVAEYGNKNKNRAYVLELEVVENPRICVFVFPPGASVNSESNLYWSHKIMPRELADRKAVYGFAIDRRFALASGTRW